MTYHTAISFRKGSRGGKKGGLAGRTLCLEQLKECNRTIFPETLRNFPYSCLTSGEMFFPECGEISFFPLPRRPSSPLKCVSSSEKSADFYFLPFRPISARYFLIQTCPESHNSHLLLLLRNISLKPCMYTQNGFTSDFP